MSPLQPPPQMFMCNNDSHVAMARFLILSIFDFCFEVAVDILLQASM